MIERLVDRHINEHRWLEMAVRLFFSLRFRARYGRRIRRAYASLDRAKAALDRKITTLEMEMILSDHANQWYRIVNQARRERRQPIDVWRDGNGAREHTAPRVVGERTVKLHIVDGL